MRPLKELRCKRETEAGKGWNAPSAWCQQRDPEPGFPATPHPTATLVCVSTEEDREQSRSWNNPSQHRQPPALQHGVRDRSTSSAGCTHPALSGRIQPPAACWSSPPLDPTLQAVKHVSKWWTDLPTSPQGSICLLSCRASAQPLKPVLDP